MIRTINSAEKCLTPDACPPIVLTAASTDVLPDVTKNRTEYAYRLIQNVGDNPCYYAIGQDCNSKNFNGMLVSGQVLDASAHTMRVSMYSTLGTTVSTTTIQRNDVVR